MASWYFTRHAQSQFNAGLTDKFNSEITKRGAEQVVRAAEMLRSEIKDPHTYIGYTSPYTRCLQTALVISKVTGINFIVTPLLGESPEEVHRGKPSVIPNGVQEFPFDWSLCPEGYNYTDEPEEKYIDRLNTFLKMLNDKQNTLVCSHMTPTIHLLRAICFGNEREMLTIGNCSISLVEDRKPVYIGM